MRGRNLGVVLVVLVIGMVSSVPVQAIDRAQVAAMKEEARAAMAQMQTVAPATKTTKAVLVRCDKGESVQAALDKNPGPVTIEIQGICAENVRIERRSDVTLRGTSGDPALDGLQGVAEPGRSAALDIRYSDRIRLENLSFSSGPVDGLMLRYSYPTIVNCQMNENQGMGLAAIFESYVVAFGLETSDNGSRGIFVDSDSYVYVEQAMVSGNAGHGIYVYDGGFLICWECDVVGNALNPSKGWAEVVARRGGFTTLWQSFVSGRNGLLAMDGYADVDCINGKPSEHPCGLSATSYAGSANGGGGVWFGLCEFEGRLIGNGGEIGLCGAQQVGMQVGARNEFTRHSLLETSGCWNLDETEYIESSLLETVLEDFSHAMFFEGTNITSEVRCLDAADALNKGAVIEGAGSVTGCAHWAP